MLTPKNEQPTQTRLENNHIQIIWQPETKIYELIFKNGSQDAVDSWLGFCHSLINNADQTNETAFRLLLDHTIKEDLPLNYVRHGVQKLLFESKRDRPPIYTAVLRHNSWVTGIVLDFAQVLTMLNRDRKYHDAVKFFEPSKRVEAIRWLQEKSSHNRVEIPTDTP